MKSRRLEPRSLGDALAVGFLRFARRAVLVLVVVTAAQWAGHSVWHAPVRTFHMTVVPQP